LAKQQYYYDYFGRSGFTGRSAFRSFRIPVGLVFLVVSGITDIPGILRSFQALQTGEILKLPCIAYCFGHRFQFYFSVRKKR
jgi:hypothetical protein